MSVITVLVFLLLGITPVTWAQEGCPYGKVRLEGLPEWNIWYKNIAGTYRLTDQLSSSGLPVYQHSAGKVFIYHMNFTTTTYWLIGEEVDKTVVISYNSGSFDHPQDVDTVWQIAAADVWEEASFRLVCAEDTGRCFTGQLKVAVHLYPSSDPLLKEATGTYTLKDSVVETRPVYKHDSSPVYLYYHKSSSGEHWVFGTVLGSEDMQYLISKDKVFFPEQITSSWYDVLSGQEVAIRFIEIQCSGGMPGTTCSTRTCENSGVCSEPYPTVTFCSCEEPYTGESCQTKVQCPDPTIPINAQISHLTGKSYRDIVLFKCDSGYELNKDYPLVSSCGLDGKWSEGSRCQSVDPPVIIVDSTGSDSDDCGTPDLPCLSLHIALKRVSERSIVKLKRPSQAYEECLDQGQEVTNDVTIMSDSEEMVEILCQKGGLFLTVTSSKLTLRDVFLRGGIISLKDAELHTEGCILEDVDISVKRGSKTGSLVVKHSEVRSTTTCRSGELCFPDSVVNFQDETVDTIKVIVEDTLMKGSDWKFSAKEVLTVKMERVVSTGPLDNLRDGFVFTLTDGNAEVTIHNCTFQNHKFWDLNGGKSIQYGAIRIEEPLDTNRSKEAAASFSVTHSNFVNNSRAICSTVAANLQLSLRYCHLEKNEALGPGGAICIIDSNQGRILKVLGLLKLAQFVAPKIKLTIQNCTLVENRAYNHRSSLGQYPGSGGALFVDVQSYATVTDCILKGNSAEESGGTLYTGFAVIGEFGNSLYQNSPEGRHAVQGDLVFSLGLIIFTNVSLQMVSADSSVSLLGYSGEDSSLQYAQLQELDVECPIGHQLILKNATGSLNTYGLFEQYQQLTYSCRPCDDGFYSLHKGFFSIKSSFSFSFFGKTEDRYTNITCKSCPYGGLCEEGKVNALPGYWGYEDGDEVLFKMCPEGYCCDEEQCGNLSQCASHRSGVLCGECEPGFSQILSDPECVNDDDCGASWVWVVYFVYGFLFVLFFLFEEEWGKFLDACTGRFKLSEIFNRFLSLPAEEGETGGLEICMYYLQTAGLLSVAIVYGEESSTQHLRDTSSRVAEVVGFDISSLLDVCVESGWNVLRGYWLTGGFPLFLFVLLGALYGMLRLPSLVLSILGQCRLLENIDDCNPLLKGTSLALDVRFSLALMELLRFTYQIIAEVTITLLHCEDVGNKSVLFVQGEVECLQGWQYVAIIVCAAYVAPLFLVMGLGPTALKKKKVSPWVFLLGCFLPPVFLIILAVRFILNKEDVADGEFTDKVVDAARGPFAQGDVSTPNRRMRHRVGDFFCWEGVIILRRLILVLIVTLVSNPVPRLFAATLVCLFILMGHIVVRPYRRAISNAAESVSLLLLCILSTCNLVRAVFAGAMVVPRGPVLKAVEVLDIIEFILVVVIPLTGLAIVLVLVLIGVVVVCVDWCRNRE